MNTKLFLFSVLLISTLNAALPTIEPATVLFFVSQTKWFGDATQAVFDATCWEEANQKTEGQEFKAAIANIQATVSDVYSRMPNGRIVSSTGTQIAANKDALYPQDPSFDVDQYELESLILDIDGNVVDEATKHVWTGSASLISIASGSDCAGWTDQNAGFGVAGNAAVTDANWWLEFFDFCNGDNGQGVFLENRVYCFQEYQGSAVIKDPVFEGFDGSHFEFQGLPNQVFNMISTRNFHMNAKFVPEGHGSFVGAVGFRVGSDEIYIDANRTILINNEPVKGQISNEQFSLKIKNDIVSFLHGAFQLDVKIVTEYRLDLKFAVKSRDIKNPVHGLVGQTINNIGNEPKIGEDNFGKGVIEGTYVDYLEESMFSTSSIFSRYVHSAQGKGNHEQSHRQHKKPAKAFILN